MWSGGDWNFRGIPSGDMQVPGCREHMNPLALVKQSSFLRRSPALWVSLWLTLVGALHGRGEDRLVGIWMLDEGFQVSDLTFRSDGRYQLDTRSTDPDFGFSFTERGRYRVSGEVLSLESDEYFGEPAAIDHQYLVEGEWLTLTRPEFSLTRVYRFKAGSKEEVLAKEKADPDPIGRWVRVNGSGGTDEFTFRPGGYYHWVRTHPEVEFPPETVRGRYTLEGSRLTLRPYSGVDAPYEADFFGQTLALIRRDPLSGEATGFELVPDSRAEVRAKAAEAEAFLARANWQVGVWEVRDLPFQNFDVTLRPDAHYRAVNHSEFLRGTVRGRYVLEPRRIRWLPFVGQDPYARSNGEFGKVEATRELDYYDGELQFIDLTAISQSVVLARKRVGSEAEVMETVRQAQAERARPGWEVGVWEVRDPLGWMEFTFRPDGRYLAKAGTEGVPHEVERGWFRVGTDRITLAPYPGQGAARGFEFDLYDGDLFLVGDLSRMVIARKAVGSEVDVVAKTQDPAALKGERGALLGRWTANLSGHSSELVFRDDGQFRLGRCTQGTASRDYGLYHLDLPTRSLVYDSRFTPVQTLGMDFYGDTLTLFGAAFGAPRTYEVHLGEVDEALAASHAADAAREEVDAQWLARVPVGPRDPNAMPTSAGDIPADPFPGRVFENPTVFTQYRLYRRLIPGFVYFNVQGRIESVVVVNSREWHFFPTGRVLVRFRNHFAGAIYPFTVEDVNDTWGAYKVGPRPAQRDILHLYADNDLFLDMDSGETAAMTLEDGRRHLFWGKDFQILSEWAAEQKPEPCLMPDDSNPGLGNTGVSLTTGIAPDDLSDDPPVLIELTLSASGDLLLRGTAAAAGPVVIDAATTLTSPMVWQPRQTNEVPAGAFTVPVAARGENAAFFRIRKP